MFLRILISILLAVISIYWMQLFTPIVEIISEHGLVAVFIGLFTEVQLMVLIARFLCGIMLFATLVTIWINMEKAWLVFTAALPFLAPSLLYHLVAHLEALSERDAFAFGFAGSIEAGLYALVWFLLFKTREDFI